MRTALIALLALILMVLCLQRVEAAPNEWPAQDHPLPCIRRWEHSHAPDDYSDRSGTYRTPYQFDRSTWDSNAKAGPHVDWVGRWDEAPPDIVDSMARVLFSRRGLQPWSRNVRRHCR